MRHIAEPPHRFSCAEDYTVQFQCGCEVVFHGGSYHRSSRMTCCSVHDSRDDSRVRNELWAEAKRRRDTAELMSPPV